MKIINTDQDAIQFFNDSVECTNVLFNGINFKQNVLEKFLGGYYNLKNVIFKGCTFQEGYERALPSYDFKFSGVLKIQGCVFENMPLHFSSNVSSSLLLLNSKFRDSSIVLKGGINNILFDSCVADRILTFFTFEFSPKLQIINSKVHSIKFDGIYPSSNMTFNNNTLNIVSSKIERVNLSTSVKLFALSSGGSTIKSLFNKNLVEELYMSVSTFKECDFSNVSFENASIRENSAFINCNMRNADLSKVILQDRRVFSILISFDKCKNVHTMEIPNDLLLRKGNWISDRYELVHKERGSGR